ncbi:gas vesicle protein K [Actinomadura sp. NPDC047616]|uniref:gas vesicle protein K n=1 Tax=Actinomadura sp. NPDC047616 TaxID=3155914 RepID=UPI0033E49EA9
MTRREPVSGDVHVHDPVPGDLFPDTTRDDTPARTATTRPETAGQAAPVRARPIRSTPASSRVRQRLETDADQVERDLVKLVLTLVELIRQLMERQALRRVDSGALDDDQIERLGLALMRLEEAMEKLKDHFDLEDGDLNLDLGPLGPLLPED